MPAPPHWGERPILRSSIIKAVKKAFQQAKIISLSNPRMLDYQISTIELEKSKKTFIVYNPASFQFIESKSNSDDSKQDIFLYMGNIYTMRQPDLLIKAFSEYAKSNSKAILRFVGNRQPEMNKYIIPKDISSKIQCHSWTTDPTDYLKNATVLIDMDIHAHDDVFISSKLIQYINTDKIILSITSYNSPSYNFLQRIHDSVVFAHHDFDQLMRAFDRTLEMNKTIDHQTIDKRRIFAESLTAKEMGIKILNQLKINS